MIILARRRRNLKFAMKLPFRNIGPMDLKFNIMATEKQNRNGYTREAVNSIFKLNQK